MSERKGKNKANKLPYPRTPFICILDRQPAPFYINSFCRSTMDRAQASLYIASVVCICLLIIGTAVCANEEQAADQKSGAKEIPEEEQQLKFGDFVQHSYSKKRLWSSFVLFKDMFDNMKSTKTSSSGENALDLPEIDSKAEFDLLLDFCEKEPQECTNIPDINSKMFSRLLPAANFLEIDDECTSRFYRNMCNKGLMGKHAQAILNKKMYKMTRRRMHKIHRRKRYGLPPKDDVIYTTLLQGFVDMLELEVRIERRSMTICQTNEVNREQYGGVVENTHKIHRRVRELRITPVALDKMSSNPRIYTWKVVRWFFWHVGIETLDVRSCSLARKDAEGISKVEGMSKLVVSGCGLGPGELVPIGKSPCMASLHTLIASWNRLSLKDMEAASKLNLEYLDVSHCALAPGFLVPIGKSKTMKALRVLISSNNTLGIGDIKEIAMLGLEELEMSACKLTPGCLVPFGREFFSGGSAGFSSIFRRELSVTLRSSRTSREAPNTAKRRTLRRLVVSDNSFGANDMEAIANQILGYLDMSNCEMLPGYLVPIGSSYEMRYLHTLIVSRNRLGLSDMEAVAKLRLRCLRMLGCSLIPGYLVVLGDSELIRKTLRTLIVSCNDFASEDMAALSKMSLCELDVSVCALEPECLRSFRDSPLQKSLRRLTATYNTLEVEDMIAISGMSLEYLNVSWCNLAPGCLVPLGASETMREALLTLIVAFRNTFNLADMQSIAKIKLKHLDITSTMLEAGWLVPFRTSTTLKETLRVLIVSCNNSIGAADMEAVAGLSLEYLNVSGCRLASGCIAFVGNSPEAKNLRTLIASSNSLGMGDITALSSLGLKHLEAADCSLAPECLTPLQNSALEDSIATLDVSNNNLGEPDATVIACMKNLLVLHILNCFTNYNDYLRILNSPEFANAPEIHYTPRAIPAV